MLIHKARSGHRRARFDAAERDEDREPAQTSSIAQPSSASCADADSADGTDGGRPRTLIIIATM